MKMAEREGFEPSIPCYEVYLLSREALSATQPSLRCRQECSRKIEEKSFSPFGKFEMRISRFFVIRTSGGKAVFGLPHSRSIVFLRIMRINGIMIDCSRLMERHEYYFRLIDFLSAWGQNVLLLHFADDWGCGIALPGFEKLAMPNAFSTDEVRALIHHGRERGVEVIPELEVFGHTRFLTDQPDYEHLYAGTKSGRLTFNAVDPLHPQTHEVMDGLIRAVAELFPSRYLHLGCDEVDLTQYCRSKGLDEKAVWTDYVNGMIERAKQCGKTPMIWADHPAGEDAIAERLRKDVVLAEWRYEEDIGDTVLPRLKEAGFKDFVVAPSLACYRYRFFPTEISFENTKRMAAIGARHGVLGLINTIWCPWRYLQNALYYGIAYSARQVQAGGELNMREFQEEFARSVFGTALDGSLEQFLNLWPSLNITFQMAPKLTKQQPDYTEQEKESFRRMRRNGPEAMAAARQYTPAKNAGIWESAVLSARAAWLCAECALAQTGEMNRKLNLKHELTAVRGAIGREWDRTRYPGDPQKHRPKFPDGGGQYALILMEKLMDLY